MSQRPEPVKATFFGKWVFTGHEAKGPEMRWALNPMKSVLLREQRGGGRVGRIEREAEIGALATIYRTSGAPRSWNRPEGPSLESVWEPSSANTRLPASRTVKK